MMTLFAHDGNATFEGVWTAITAAKGFDATLLSIPKGATHWVRYITGATAALRFGEILHGETSTSTATLVDQAIESGTTGGGNQTGIVFVKSPSAAFQAEIVHGDITDGHITIAEDFIALNKIDPHPKTLLIGVETASIHVSLTGTAPTATSGTNYGITVTAGQSWVIRGHQNIRNFKCINETNANGAILKYVLYY